MIRALTYLSALLAMFALHLAILALSHTRGFMAPRVIDLWATGLASRDATLGFRQTEAFYPPLPDTLSTLFAYIVPGAIPAPLVLSACVASCVTVLWFRNFRQKGGYGWIGATTLTAFATLNPFFLRSVAEGPGMVLMLLGTWIYMRGLVNLRLRGSAPDIMKIGVGLLIVVLSHSYGILIAIASLPSLLLAGRPDQLRNAPMGFLVTMNYPVFLAAASIFFVGQVFDLPILSPQPGSGSVQSVWAVFVAFAVLIPPFVTSILLLSDRPRFWLPLMAGILTLIIAALLNFVVGFIADPILVAAPLLGLVVVAIRFWPFSERRGPIAAMLLAISAVTAVPLFLGISGPSNLWAMSLISRSQIATDQAPDAVEHFLTGKTDILIDVERNHEIIIAHNGTQGMIVAGQPRYDLALRTGVTDANLIITRDDDAVAAADRVSRAMGIDQFGAPSGYDEVFAVGQWRIYERSQ